MRSILPLAFCAFATLIGMSALQSASATVNDHRERAADALCQVDPTACGQRP